MDVSRRDMQDVVMVEDDDVRAVDGGEAGPRGPGEPGERGELDQGAETLDLPPAPFLARWPRSVRQWAPVAVGLVLVLVATSTVLVARREGARLAALAELPGVVATLERPVSVRWRDDGGQFLGLVAFDGRLVGAQERDDGTIDVVGLDPVTGRDVWRTQARGSGSGSGTRTSTVRGLSSCALPEDALPEDTLPEPSPGAPAATERTVACIVIDATTESLETALGTAIYPTKARLVVLDAATGALRSDEDTDPTTHVAAFGTDLVLSHVDADGHLVVTRTDGRATAVRWTFTSPDPVGKDAFGQSYAGAYTDGRTIVAIAATTGATGDGTEERGTSTWIISADGVADAVNPGSELAADGWVQPLRGGQLLAVSATIDGKPSTKVVHRDSGRAFTAEAYPVLSVPDDGSLDDLLLMQRSGDGALGAYDLATGRLRWSNTEPTTGGTMIVDGRVIQAGTKELYCLDGQTGAVVWTTPITSEWSSLTTDGHLVLMSQATSADGATFTTYGLDDGRRHWRTTAAELDADVSGSWPGYLNLTAIGGRLIGWTDTGIVALG